MNSRLLKVLKILVCPCCKSNLYLANNVLICVNEDCGAHYDIIDGVPLMLPPNAISSWSNDQKDFFDNLAKEKAKPMANNLPNLDRFFDEDSRNRIIEYIITLKKN